MALTRPIQQEVFLNLPAQMIRIQTSKRVERKLTKVELVICGKPLKTMTVAVNEWDAMSGRYYNDDGMACSMTQFANVCGIPPETFRKYACTDKGKRRTLGASLGRPALVSSEQSQFVADVIRRADRANDGKTVGETIQIVQDLVPKLSRKQASNSLKRTIRRHHKDVLTKTAVVAQGTTTRRTAITLGQQFRWHKTYDQGLEFLRTKNTGVCRVTGKTFGLLLVQTPDYRSSLVNCCFIYHAL